MIIQFTPNHHAPKKDVLPKTFLQIILAAKWLVRHSSTSPNQQRRPLPSLLPDSDSCSMVCTVCTVDWFLLDYIRLIFHSMSLENITNNTMIFIYGIDPPPVKGGVMVGEGGGGQLRGEIIKIIKHPVNDDCSCSVHTHRGGKQL